MRFITPTLFATLFVGASAAPLSTIAFLSTTTKFLLSSFLVTALHGDVGDHDDSTTFVPTSSATDYEYNDDGDVDVDDDDSTTFVPTSAPPDPTPAPAPTPDPTPTPDPVTSDDDTEIGTSEVLAVGVGTVESPHGTVGITNDQLTIVTFFEAHQSLFEGSGGIDQAITIEVFANVDKNENDCTKGTLLYDGYSTGFEDYQGPDDPVKSNGMIGSAKVTFSNFQYDPNDDDKKIWFLGDGDKDGEIRLCVVTSIKIDIDNIEGKDYVRHMDSKRVISIDLVADIGEQAIEITESKATNSESDAVLYVEVVTFLCNNKHMPVPDVKKYKSGQDFRICVGPKLEGIEKGYKVDQFIELICGGRTLVIPEVGDEPLTNTGTAVLTTADGVYLNNNLAIQSVLTANDVRDIGTSSITCTGKVSLSYTNPECIALCDNTPGNRRDPIPADTKMTEDAGFVELVQSYLNNEPDAAKAKYGDKINCWDISRLTSLSYAFYMKSSFNEPLNCWDTAHVTDMSAVFEFASAFNQDINSWDTSSVEGMWAMFSGGDSFNQDLNAWDTSNVSYMDYMFVNAKAFDQDLNDWDTSNVYTMEAMFDRSLAFNQDVSTWNTSSVTSMPYMFDGATAFNQDINAWDTSNVVDMVWMFSDATAFNQNLCDWDISSDTHTDDMFAGSKCSDQNYPIGKEICQSCDEARRLDSSNNSNNNNKRSNKRRRNLPGMVGDDDTSVVAAPFHMIATTVNNAEGPVRGAGRDLQPLTGVDLSGGGGEGEELLEGLFEVNIEMDIIPNNEASSSAPFLPSSMTTTTTTTVVAILGCFGSLLSIVSSMIW